LAGAAGRRCSGGKIDRETGAGAVERSGSGAAGSADATDCALD